MKLHSRCTLFVAVAFSLASLLYLAGCGGKEASSTASTEETAPEVTETATSTEAAAQNSSTPVATTINYASQPTIYGTAETAPIANPVVILHTSAGDIQMELFME